MKIKMLINTVTLISEDRYVMPFSRPSLTLLERRFSLIMIDSLPFSSFDLKQN